MELKTYVAQFINKYGNGWAIVNAYHPNQVEDILKNQGRFKDIIVTSFKEVKHFGNTMSIVYEGSITTLGKTPYDLAKEEGFEGTLEEWLETLKGPKGDKGEQGDKGDSGEQGPQGEKGDPGTTDYNELKNTPTNVSAFNNDAGYLTQHQDISGKVDKIEGKGLSTNDYTTQEKNKLAELENYDDKQVRQLIVQTNANFSNYYTKSESYSASEVDTLLRTQKQGQYVVVSTLPIPSADTMFKIYLVPSIQQEIQNVKDEFVTLENNGTYSWEQIGTTTIDLSGYSTTEEMNATIASTLASYYTKSEVDEALGSKQNTLTFDTTPQSGSFNPVTSEGMKNALDTKEETANKVTSISPSSTDTQYPSANAVVNAIGKRGVISQKQTWTSDFSSYTMSNIVIGIIPQAAIDLYEEAGATFNENGHQTGIGYFELNGITDLSYQNIKDAYDFSYHNNGLWTCYEKLPRTNFPLCNGVDFGGGVEKHNQAMSLHLYYLNGRMEVLRLSRELKGNYGASLSQYSGYMFYYNSQTIREVMGVMDIYNMHALETYFFSGTTRLKTAKFRGLNSNINLKRSHVLSIDSVVYMVQNSANTSAVTITLHQDVYAVCQADTTEYTYQGNTYTGIIALATAKNITIATA